MAGISLTDQNLLFDYAFVPEPTGEARREVYEWEGHFDRRGQPDRDYLRNRIARLAFDLKTGKARIEK